MPGDRTLQQLELPVGRLLHAIPQGRFARQDANDRVVFLAIDDHIRVREIAAILPVIDQQIAFYAIERSRRVLLAKLLIGGATKS